MEPLCLGNIQVTRVVETEGPTSVRFLFPQLTAEDFKPHLDWIAPWFYDAGSHRLLMSIHSFVVRAGGLTILVDTCVGNDKRRSNAGWNMKTGPFLPDLQAAGVEPAEVDFVLCTHLHSDHVGWNTRWEDGAWLPTFPNARYLVSEAELASTLGTTDPDQVQLMEDSVTPIMAAGLLDAVPPNQQLAEGVCLVSTPGHTAGHVSLHLQGSRGNAVVTGDMMHHPLQIARPEISSRFCADPVLATATRKNFLECYSNGATWILGTHFASPTRGTLQRDGSHFRLRAQAG